jgi:hypothetical protein
MGILFLSAKQVILCWYQRDLSKPTRVPKPEKLQPTSQWSHRDEKIGSSFYSQQERLGRGANSRKKGIFKSA